jgi:hypothetical protein
MKSLGNTLKDLYDHGVIDESALEKAAEYKEYLDSEGLNKEANGVSASTEVLGAQVMDRLSKALALGALIAGATKGVDALTAGVSSLYNKATFGRDLNKVLSDNPDLSKNYDKKDIESYYKTLRTFAPSISKDSNASRGFLMNALQYKDVGLPVSVIKELTSQHKDHSAGGTTKSLLDIGMSQGVGLMDMNQNALI